MNSAMTTGDERKQALLNELRADLSNAPVEAGMDHEAERTLERALRSDRDGEALEWIAEFCCDAERPSVSAAILVCLANVARPGTNEWRANLVERALSMESVEIRDAAVQAAETWGGQRMVRILEQHSESVPWLREYVDGVIGDLAIIINRKDRT